jgi:hypothetical protein
MPTRAKAGQDFLASKATQEQHAEGISVERVGDEIANGRRMLARVGPVWAGAARLEFARSRQQVETD